MLKAAFLVALGASGAFLASGRVTYSGTQAQLFPGAALKTAPDPSNIWSFHETVTVSRDSTIKVPVLVDFDRNGKMDTENKAFRVLITDMQLAGSGHDLGNVDHVHLQDSAGVRWDLSPRLAERTLSTIYDSSRNHHLRTPLALPISSELNVEIKSGGRGATTVTINLIGRLVSM